MTCVRLLLFAACLGLLAGCSSKPKGSAPPETITLQEVNDMLHSAAGALSRPPSRLADLDRYQSMYPRGYEAVKSGNVVVLWATPLKGEGTAGKNEAVLAYEKSVPTDGGYVLLSAGTIKEMSAAEFKSASAAK
jgi:hypothetical protein